MRFPPNRRDIEHFEKINGIKIHCMAANVHKKEIFHYKPAIAPDILLILFFNRNNKAHWCVIPDDKHFSRLISAQQSDHHGALKVCSNCHFVNPPTKEGLKAHQELCLENKPQILSFPKTIKGEEIKFKNVCKEERVPIVLSCDFESRLRKKLIIKGKKGRNIQLVAEHIPIAYGISIKSSNEKVYKSNYQSYMAKNENDNVAYKFLKHITELRDEISKIPVADMIITEKQECEHILAKQCYICNQEFTPDDWKVRDHNHFTGEYRGPADNSCNLRRQKRKHIPVPFHNSKYDLNLFVREFARFPEYDIKILPRNTEKFISVSITKVLGKEWDE